MFILNAWNIFSSVEKQTTTILDSGRLNSYTSQYTDPCVKIKSDKSLNNLLTCQCLMLPNCQCADFAIRFSCGPAGEVCRLQTSFTYHQRAVCYIFLLLTRPHDLQSLLSKTLLLCILILDSWSDWHVQFMRFDNTKGWCGIMWGKFLFVRSKWTLLYRIFINLFLSYISGWHLFHSCACSSGVTASMDEILTRMTYNTVQQVFEIFS